MSGSDSGSYGGVFEQFNSCDSLVIDTQLASPKDDVIESINVGDLLDIAIQTSGSQSIVVVLHNGKIAGGVAAPQVQKLRECISQGTKYNAVVLDINGGQVSIRIKKY